MRRARFWSLALALAAAVGGFATASQTAPPPRETPAETSAPPPAETPTPAPAPPAPAAATPAPAPAPVRTPVPIGPAPRRLLDAPIVSISHLPETNPFGLPVEEPAALPAKPAFAESIVPTSLFAAVRVDPTGKVVQSRLIRDPIPAVAAESRRSFEQRWVFDPAVQGGKPVETWASVRLDFQVEVRPREEQATLTPITPATPLPSPVAWGDDAKWYDSYRTSPPADGTIPVEQVDTAPVPKKTKWGADSYKGPFSCHLWIKVNSAGRVEKMIPIQASDPVLVPYMRKTVAAWVLRPARLKGQPVDSWNELAVSGQISYSIDLKQINNLRKTLVTQ